MNRVKAALWLCAIGLIAGLCASCAPEPPPLPAKEKPSGATAAGPKATGLQGRIEETIKLIRSYEVRPSHGFWTVFHAILGLGPKAAELIDDKTNQRINALDYVCSGRPMRGLDFVPTRFGVDVLTNNPTGGEMHFSQGHQDQFIAEMTQWALSPDQKFLVKGKDPKDDREYRFRDFINHCKMRASLRPQQPPQELSWAIVVIPYYLGTDASWVNELGEPLNVEKLVQAEVRASINEAACGGTHRLFGLAWAYHLHLRRGGKTEGVWKEVADHLDKYKQITKDLRNRGDGSFSTAFSRQKENDPDLGKRINTTGHTLEWLSLAMTEEELRQGWVEDAANALTLMIFKGQNRPVPGGGLYHAAHGLLLYYARVYDARRLSTLEPVIPLPSNGMPWRSAGMPELKLPGVFSLR